MSCLQNNAIAGVSPGEVSVQQGRARGGASNAAIIVQNSGVIADFQQFSTVRSRCSKTMSFERWFSHDACFPLCQPRNYYRLTCKIAKLLNFKADFAILLWSLRPRFCKIVCTDPNSVAQALRTSSKLKHMSSRGQKLGSSHRKSLFFEI